MKTREPVQLRLPIGDVKDTGVRAFELYTYLDRDNKRGYEGHVRYVAASDIREARHRVAFDFPRYWMWCGLREVAIDHLKKQVVTFENQYNRAKAALEEIESSERNNF